MQQPLAEAFWQRVEKIAGVDCWLWTGAMRDTGYGWLWSRGTGKRKNILAHRVGYELQIGPIGDGLFVCHKCDVRACVRGSHLFLGTCEDNTFDAMRKGYGASWCRKLSDSQVAYIRSSGKSQRQLARELGVTQPAIGYIRRWEHYRWLA